MGKWEEVERSGLINVELAIDSAKRKTSGTPKGYSALGSGNDATKQGVEALVYEEPEQLDKFERAMKAAQEELKVLDLSEPDRLQHQVHLGQEIAEFNCVKALWEFVAYDVNPQPIPSPEKLGISSEDWLNGLVDAPGELLKMTGDFAYLKRREFSPDELLELRERCVEAMEFVRFLLSKVIRADRINPHVLTPERGRFVKSFRDKFTKRVEWNIAEAKRKTLELCMLIALHRSPKETVSATEINDLDEKEVRDEYRTETEATG